MPGWMRKKIGKRGIPALVLPQNLKVTTEPSFGGFFRSLSVKPDPILNSVPSASRTYIAPHIVSQRPEPLWWPITVASASSNLLTFRRLQLLVPSYFELGSFSITPSPFPPHILSISSTKCFLSLHLVYSIIFTVSFGFFASSYFSVAKRLLKLPLNEGASNIINLIVFHFSTSGSYLLTMDTID